MEKQPSSDQLAIEHKRTKTLDTIIYILCHKLRGSLAAIQGLVVLGDSCPNTQETVDFLRMIGKQADDMDGDISSILSYLLSLQTDPDKTTIESVASSKVSNVEDGLPS